jgi:hypothetical protein
MYERLLLETGRHLKLREGSSVPIMQLWRSMTREAVRKSFSVPSLSDFSCLLEGDKRFELITDPAGSQAMSVVEVVDDEEMGKLGFLGSQRVRLRTVPVKNDEDDDESEGLADAEGEEGDPLLDRALLSEGRGVVRSVKGHKANASTLPKQFTGSGKTAPAAKGKAAPKKKTASKASSVKRRK